ncbi:polymorphic toxin type 15 domain-containing protein [Acidiphilium acidophilum]|uniref:polymorphic toxin type 15 domain-containing protein n=1 Tax=Acidiphilium acidophilum TaxID=76588 RepID=UPI002E8E7979|nr:polymorphic toxin type 15 domain-containing protein [Acidiphilium acidophilum]
MSPTILPALLAADSIPFIDAIALPLTVGVLAVTAAEVLRAHEASESQLSSRDTAKPSVDCAEAIPCFETPKGQSTKDMAQQLKDQQDTINDQSPEEMQKRLDEADSRRQTTGSYRPEGDANARENARSNYQTDRQAELESQFQEEGLTPEEAAKEAATQTAKEMAGMDATHALDAIAGGAQGDSLTMANRSINRSIGAQWKSRVKALKKAVKQALKRGDKHMDVKLEPCEDEPES